MLRQAQAWLAHRFGVDLFKQQVLDRKTPKGAWYYGDGASLMLLLGVQVLTGAVLMLTYSPAVDNAYASVQHITHEQMLGRYVRSLHYWSAGLMVVMLVWHVARQLLLGGYKSPREGTWLLGVMLFFAVLTMSFTGYVLRWDERSIYALRVSLHMMANVPWLGEWLVVLVQGGPEIGPQTLTRVYAVHVFLIPLVLFVLVGWHLYLVIRHGVTTQAERGRAVTSTHEQRELYNQEKEDPKLGERFHPGTTFCSGLMAMVVFAAAVVLAVVVGPSPLYPEANLTERSFPAEEWWFWWYSALIALLPTWVAPTFVVVFPIIVLLVMVLLPFVDRYPHRGVRKRPVVVTVVLLALVGLVWLSALRLYSPWTAWPQPGPPAVPVGVVLPAEAEHGRQLFARYGCNTCHAVAGVGPVIGPDLARIEPVYSREEFRQWILHPSPTVSMPSYAGRMEPEDLERIIDYLMNAQTFPRQRR